MCTVAKPLNKVAKQHQSLLLITYYKAKNMLELKLKPISQIKKPQISARPIKARTITMDATNPLSELNDKAQLKVSRNDVYVFTRQLSNLLKAGMEIPVALEILAGQTSRVAMQKLIRAILTDVNAGKSLAETISAYPNIFNNMYINVVYSAQTGGDLDKALQYIADLLERRNKLQSQVNRTLAYPCLMLVVSILVIIFLLTTVIPNITSLFLETGRELPMVTRSLIFLSKMTQIAAPYLLLTIASGLFALSYYLRKQANRQKWDKMKLNMPLIGPFLLKIETSRLCRSLCAMLRGGLNIVDSLELATAIMQNRYVQLSVINITEGINKGMSLEESFRRNGVFPPMIHHAIAIGESTGQLEKQLASMADIVDEDLNNTTSFLTSMMEPVIMLAMGVITGYIVAALLLPIFEINSII